MQNQGRTARGRGKNFNLHTQPQVTGDDDTKSAKKAAAVCGTEPEVLSGV